MIASLVLPMSLDTTKVDSFGQYLCVKTGTEDKCTKEANPFTLTLTVVPEVPLPAALPLMAAGLGAMGLMGWRRKRRMA